MSCFVSFLTMFTFDRFQQKENNKHEILAKDSKAKC